MKILITGTAGFIGFHLAQKLISRGDEVVGLDNINDYYDPELKKARLKELEKFLMTLRASDIDCPYFQFIKMDLADRQAMQELFNNHKFDVVINLAAQAGVRYSLENPHAYVDSNLVGFVNILEGCRHAKVGHLVYASSSSVYGMNVKQPFRTDDRVDYPISLYAATKKANELMAHTYSHLYGLPTTGLRFFTVYGPWGRPDMAYFKFTKAILAGKAIDVYNHGQMQRDFTYIDDIVDGILRVMGKPPVVSEPPSQPSPVEVEGAIVSAAGHKNIIPSPHWGEGQGEGPENPTAHKITNAEAPYKIYNIGNNQPVTLRHFITAIENACGKKAIENSLPMQAGDVPITYADINDLTVDTGFKPTTSIDVGIAKFGEWYRSYIESIALREAR